MKLEKSYLKKIFQSDSKNYHAWSYRVWLIERFQMWEGEMEDVEGLLDEDVCNNSAWSYRYFLLHKSPAQTYNSLIAGSPEFVEAEMKYLLGERLPFKWDNEACWVYLRGMFCQTPEEEQASKNKPIKRCCIVRYKDFLGP